jgi:hypothetical protein
MVDRDGEHPGRVAQAALDGGPMLALEEHRYDDAEA